MTYFSVIPPSLHLHEPEREPFQENEGGERNGLIPLFKNTIALLLLSSLKAVENPVAVSFIPLL